MQIKKIPFSGNDRKTILVYTLKLLLQNIYYVRINLNKNSYTCPPYIQIPIPILDHGNNFGPFTL